MELPLHLAAFPATSRLSRTPMHMLILHCCAKQITSRTIARLTAVSRLLEPARCEQALLGEQQKQQQQQGSFDYLEAQNEEGRMPLYSETNIQACEINWIEKLRQQLEEEPKVPVALDREELKMLQNIIKERREKGLKSFMRRADVSSDYTVDPEQLVRGDYVVHKRVGVGKFISMNYETPEGQNKAVKYIYLKYADGTAKLPAKQARRLLYRYFLPGEVGKKAPALSKLHDTTLWEKRKNKGKLDIQKLVVKMVEVYIHRLKQKRTLYPKRSTEMGGFAASFPYKPTLDQMQAFFDVEKDMTERETPMDRLVCGDVGFGKTEVAMRAIFYAVEGKRQVMVLAPTTVLAKQHYKVIHDRFSGYHDLKVALLSRFQNNLERKKVISGIHDGSLNIIVGTHALLGSQIRYANVGLVIIDEEQRFGVKQKEKIASLKTTVDVLTLSATPIPRTLYMALNGFRDASLIATPPPERRPIKTHVCEYNKEKMERAIRYELDRMGQVFYVVPRIQGIKDVQAMLKSSFPDVGIAIAHGKQSAKELDKTMEEFTEGGVQILLCTSIIENGLDVATVNTIIIEDAHLLGLAQIYQLRGRVGRSGQEAHAYLFHPRKEFLTTEASRRLAAIEECCELGQGFQLAERDMSIRGIGNVFGERQSGDLKKIGVDLYAEMLFDALSKVDYHSIPQLEFKDVQLEVDINAHACSIPETEKLIGGALQSAEESIYALMSFTTNAAKQLVPIEMLMKTIFIKRMAADLGIYRVVATNRAIIMETYLDDQALKLLCDAMDYESVAISIILRDSCIQLQSVLELTVEQQFDYIFYFLSEMRKSLPSFIKHKAITCR